ALLVAGHLGHDGGYRESSGYDQQKALLRYDGRVGDWDLSSSFSYQNLEQDTAGFITGEGAYRDLAQVKSNDNPEAYRNASAMRAHARFRKTLANGTEVHLTPYARSTDMEFL